MTSFRPRQAWAAIAGFLLLLIALFPTVLSQSPDTTPPTFVRATTSRSGIEVVVTLSQDIAVSSLVTDLAERYGVSEGMILKDVMSVTVDGTENVLVLPLRFRPDSQTGRSAHQRGLGSQSCIQQHIRSRTWWSPNRSVRQRRGTVRFSGGYERVSIRRYPESWRTAGVGQVSPHCLRGRQRQL